MEYRTDVSEFWRLADSVTIVQAALLLLGIEPQSAENNVENCSPEDRPNGYNAARDAIASAIQGEVIQGQIEYHSSDDRMGNPDFDCRYIDFSRSAVKVLSLIVWLEERGFETAAFALPKDKPMGFRDSNHPRYAPKLLAAVEAWESYNTESTDVGTVKQRLMIWLRLNASRYGLTDEDGNPSENVIEELAKAANWEPSGGKPKSKS